ncbi:MAG TPA: alpha-L-fucosidase [Chitinophagaceae bacterium]|nr:alpha-L-fucosidase [Chitinophagaceae bacterium]
MKNFYWLSLLCMVFTISAVSQSLPHPEPRQLQWQQMETNAFLHFTVNTFTNKEWGEGTESESVFNPTRFDARQWIKALKEAGFKTAILTCKHHDGFCLWPSKYTDHSVKNSPWKNGKGDIVKEVSDACREYGLKFGIYLSPWDRHEKTYGTDAYNTYYKNQLRELLTHYGNISEVWFDGAKGANAKDMQYDFKGYWKLVRELQPGAVIFSDAGPDIRWVGNESGAAGDTCWSTLDTTGLAPGHADPKYLNTGDPNGREWVPAETDVSVRPGWFWHESENDKVKTPQEIVNLYYQSVGRNSLLLLNIPPDKDGLLYPADVANIIEFRKILNETFAHNLALHHTASSLTDKNLHTFISVENNKPLVIDFAKPVTFDRALLQENIANGERIKNGLLEYWDGSSWKKIDGFVTVGYKRLFRFKPVTTSRVRVTILASKATVQLAEIGFYKASEKE